MAVLSSKMGHEPEDDYLLETSTTMPHIYTSAGTCEKGHSDQLFYQMSTKIVVLSSENISQNDPLQHTISLTKLKLWRSVVSMNKRFVR